MAESKTEQKAEQKAKREPTSPEYALIEVEGDLPPIDRGGRASQLQELIAQLRHSTRHGKWFCVARYNVHTTATAAANNLRHKFGTHPEVMGWDFATRRVDDKTGLFAKFDPKVVVDGEYELWEKSEAERRHKSAERKEAKAADEQKTAAKK